MANEYISLFAWLLEVIFPSYQRLIESRDVKLPGTSKPEMAREYILLWAWLLSNKNRIIQSFHKKLPGTSKREMAREYI
jgi:hypothetical protein